jgi:hypothetical protein
MKLKEMLNELAAVMDQKGVRVTDRRVPATTRYTPEQIANSIRHKVLSTTKIIDPMKITDLGNNKYKIVGSGTSMTATFDNASGKVELFKG